MINLQRCSCFNTCVLHVLMIAITGYVTGKDRPTVTIPQGSVQGTFEKSYGGRKYSAFEGIPYGKAPLGELRFAEPEPAGKWNGILVANQLYRCLSFSPIPFMYGVKGSEDCLYVNVYVPLEKIHGNESLDVIVHIHGGYFMIAAPADMSGPAYIMDKDVVFVSFNYRLAILGFMSTEDDIVPGNNGMKDQVLALEWVRDNIRYFGGKPDSVTIAGTSSGGSCAHLHYLSPLSKGLFHKGFSLSGTALASWSLTEYPLKKAKLVAKHLQCPTNSTTTMVDCLRKVDGKELLLAMKKLLVFIESIPFSPFGPVIERGPEERRFLPHHPYKLLKEGKINDVPWVTSNARDEGIYPTVFFVVTNTLGELDSRWNEIMPYVLDIQDTVKEELKMNVVTKVRKHYLGDEHISENNKYSLIRMFSDRHYYIDGEKAARLHTNVSKSPVYYYFFSYSLQQPFFVPGFKMGVSHCDDCKLLFKIIGTPCILEAEDRKMMQLFTEFITSYAKTNEPSFGDFKWLPLDPSSKSLNVLRINGPGHIFMDKFDRIGDNDFWNSLPIMENEKIKNFL
ncbi:carboxylic ester hydrolase-like [Leptinotarsa decemlineata]|uniref:carboxylic ester hydrolase-like n=1 Tax=Leptinotarsa decemlineata TaxID=7539 RepID=UPI003D305B8B